MMQTAGKLYGSVFDAGDFPHQDDPNRVPLHVERRSDNGMSGTVRSWDGSIIVDLVCEPTSVSLATIREAGWYDKRTGSIKLYDGFVGEALIKYRASDITSTISGIGSNNMFDDARFQTQIVDQPEAEATERDHPPGYRIPNYKGKSKYNRKKKERVKNKHKR